MKSVLKWVVALLFLSDQAYAAEGGYSNYIPGFYGDIALATAPPPGLSIRNDLYSYSADEDVSIRSGLIEADVEIELTYNYTSFIYNPEVELFGAQFTYGAVLAYGKVELDGSLAVGGFSQHFNDDKTDMGDVTLIPAALYWQVDNFHFSLAQYVVAPTADYDKNDSANTGLNYWTYETDVAMTYLNESTGQDYSVVFGYNYNSENTDTDYQTGEEVHVDFVLNQFLSESWAVGIHGFALQQVTNDSGRGAILGGFKARAAGVGPAVMWIPPAFNGEVAFVAKWINEFDSKNRLEGDHIFLSFMMSF